MIRILQPFRIVLLILQILHQQFHPSLGHRINAQKHLVTTYVVILFHQQSSHFVTVRFSFLHINLVHEYDLLQLKPLHLHCLNSLQVIKQKSQKHLIIFFSFLTYTSYLYSKFKSSPTDFPWTPE